MLRVLCLIGLLPGLPAQAAWTGIAAFIGEGEALWRVAGNLQQADINRYGLRIEEKSATALRVGASAGQTSLRLRDLSNLSLAQKYNGQFLTFYLRWPQPLSDHLSLHSQLDYQLNVGSTATETDVEQTDIDWSETSFTLGLSLRLGVLSIHPYLRWYNINGDITLSDGSRVFEEVNQQSEGIMLDYAVERYAYVRLQSQSGQERLVQLSFVREY